MDAKELIGLDIGEKQTGIARASSVARIAEPLKSVPTNKLIDELKDMLNDENVEAIAIGLPRNLSGEDTGQTKWVRDWVNDAKPKLMSPMFWIDEALTSKNASGSGDEHSSAAAIMLQDFINTPEGDRVAC